MTYNSVPTTIYCAIEEKSKFKMLNSDNSWHGNNWVVWKVGYSEYIHDIKNKSRTRYNEGQQREQNSANDSAPIELFIDKNIYIWSNKEAVVKRCSVKKVFLEISQNSQENTCARVSI